MFGIGLPALALMLNHSRVRSNAYRTLQALGWAFLVLAIPLLVARWPQSAQMAQSPVISLQEFQRAVGAAKGSQSTLKSSDSKITRKSLSPLRFIGSLSKSSGH